MEILNFKVIEVSYSIMNSIFSKLYFSISSMMTSVYPCSWATRTISKTKIFAMLWPSTFTTTIPRRKETQQSLNLKWRALTKAATRDKSGKEPIWQSARLIIFLILQRITLTREPRGAGGWDKIFRTEFWINFSNPSSSGLYSSDTNPNFKMFQPTPPHFITSLTRRLEMKVIQQPVIHYLYQAGRIIRPGWKTRKILSNNLFQ